MQNKKCNYLGRYFETFRVFRFQDGNIDALSHTRLSWTVCNKKRGIEFHVEKMPDEKKASEFSKEFPDISYNTLQFGIVIAPGIETHSPIPLHSETSPPTSEFCHITHGKCWSIGTSLGASEFLDSLQGDLRDDLIFNEISRYWPDEWSL
jgi:hypothetical protein